MQTSVETQLEIGMPGQLADSGSNDVITGINNSKQRITTVISAADLSTTLTINGTAFNVNAGAATLTVTELRDLMITAINAGSEPVTASINDADELFVDADVSGAAFTYADTVNVSSTDIILNETNVSFGSFVSLNNTNQRVGDKRLVHLPQTATDVTNARIAMGFALHTHAVENALTGGNLGYEPQSAVSILRRGRVYVTVEDAVLAGGQVFVRHVAGAGEKLGDARSDADGSDASALPSASFMTAADAGEVAIVEINLP